MYNVSNMFSSEFITLMCDSLTIHRGGMQNDVLRIELQIIRDSGIRFLNKSCILFSSLLRQGFWKDTKQR